MPTRTVSPTQTRSRSRPLGVSDALTLVADPVDAGPEQPVPDWVLTWCRRSRWRLQAHPAAGATAATAAAREGARVLVLRPGTAWPATLSLNALEPGRLRTASEPASEPAVERAVEPVVEPARVVAAVRGLPDDRAVVADAATCAALLGARLVIVHAVPRSFAGRSVGLDGAVTDGRRLLESAAGNAAVRGRGLVVDCELLRARPYEVVGETLRADLLVVGGPRLDRRGGGPAGDELGLVAHSALRHAPCPVLLTPR